MYIANKDDCNYLHQFLCAQSEMGKLSLLIVVNNHIFNHVDPDQIIEHVDKLKNYLDLFVKHYKEERTNATLDMEH